MNHSSAGTGEIEVEYLILSLHRCRVATYPQITEAFIELLFLRDIIVGP